MTDTFKHWKNAEIRFSHLPGDYVIEKIARARRDGMLIFHVRKLDTTGGKLVLLPAAIVVPVYWSMSQQKVSPISWRLAEA